MAVEQGAVVLQLDQQHCQQQERCSQHIAKALQALNEAARLQLETLTHQQSIGVKQFRRQPLQLALA